MKYLRTTLLLTREQKDALDERATQIRRATGVRPGASALIRAAIEAMQSRLDGVDFAELFSDVAGDHTRSTEIAVEQRLSERLSK